MLVTNPLSDYCNLKHYGFYLCRKFGLLREILGELAEWNFREYFPTRKLKSTSHFQADDRCDTMRNLIIFHHSAVFRLQVNLCAARAY